MGKENYKYININGFSIAYKDEGSGQPILFVHGFASFSYTWKKLINFLPQCYRFISIDLKGFGYSEKICDNKLTPFDQSDIVIKFIEKLALKNIILIGHSMGGAISLLSLFKRKIKRRTSKLILIDSAGLFYNFPGFIEDILETSSGNIFVRNINEEILVSYVLEKVFFDKNKIPEDAAREYAKVLKQENARECLKKAADQIAISNINWFLKNIKKINIPSLIIWGRNDSVVYLEDSILFKARLDAFLKIIPNCGHVPQEEKPEETAKIIQGFLDENLDKDTIILKNHQPSSNSHSDNNITEKATVHDKKHSDDYSYLRKLRMRRLIDKWRVDTFILIVIVKILQFIKKLGFRVEENGWRKFASVFLRKEHSKFMFTAFRLTPFYKRSYPKNINTAKKEIIKKLAQFLRENTVSHWSSEWGFFRAKSKQTYFTDIVEGIFNRDGKLLTLIPYFDDTRKTFTKLTDKVVKDVLKRLVDVYNENERKNIKDSSRPKIIQRKLHRWALKARGLSYSGRWELIHLIKRILNSTFIHFEVLPDYTAKSFQKTRFSTPDVNRKRHMGYGLLNIVCRIMPDYKETDIWFQYHHVPVDGMPMEEMMEKFKKEWGTAGKIKFPSLSSDAAKPEILNYGKKVFRGRIFVEFSKLIKFRKYLNQKYFNEMGGPATITSMIIWGLAQRKYFKNTKFVVTTETAITVDYPQDRNIGLVIIRPGKYITEHNKLQGFFNFQREMNHRIFATRFSRSETSELLEIYAMLHPLFFHITKFFLPKAMREMLGTAGLTILKNVELFISPITDLQINGFVAIGNMNVKTEDGKTASSVSFCAAKHEILEYLEAFKCIVDILPKSLDLKDSTA
jgi:pimeloyl-ACP methyl ester carboxylesterase